MATVTKSSLTVTTGNVVNTASAGTNFLVVGPTAYAVLIVYALTATTIRIGLVQDFVIPIGTTQTFYIPPSFGVSVQAGTGSITYTVFTNS